MVYDTGARASCMAILTVGGGGGQVLMAVLQITDDVMKGTTKQLISPASVNDIYHFQITNK